MPYYTEFMEITQPTPEDIRSAVSRAGVTRAEAAALVHVSKNSWHCWASPEDTAGHRQMPAAAWELLLLKLDQHPTKKIIDR